MSQECPSNDGEIVGAFIGGMVTTPVLFVVYQWLTFRYCQPMEGDDEDVEGEDVASRRPWVDRHARATWLSSTMEKKGSGDEGDDEVNGGFHNVLARIRPSRMTMHRFFSRHQKEEDEGVEVEEETNYIEGMDERSDNVIG